MASKYHKKHMENTLAIIQTTAIVNRSNIVNKLLQLGFFVLQKRILNLSAEQVEQLYDYDIASSLQMTSKIKLSEGPIEVLCLAKENAIKDLIQLITSRSCIQAQTSEESDISQISKDSIFDGVVCSKNKEAALKQIHFFFPKFIPELIHKEAAMEICNKSVFTKILMDGLYRVSKKRPPNPANWLGHWLLENNTLNPVIQIGPQKSYELQPSTSAESSYLPASLASSNRSSYMTVDLDSCSCQTNSIDFIKNSENTGNDDPEKSFNGLRYCPLCKRVLSSSLNENLIDSKRTTYVEEGSISDQFSASRSGKFQVNINIKLT